MNWFTRSYLSGSPESMKRLIEEDGGCEHVVANPALACMVSREKDSFGTVGQYVMCKECDDKAQAAKQEAIYACCDCKELKPLKDGINWRPYDFIASEGDTTTFVCNSCRPKEKHQQRVENDRLAFEDEFGSRDNDW